MSTPARPLRAITMFSGGRGGASIARRLLDIPGLDLSLVINGYDNGLSTGALRRYLPGMLGPSDFRKNLLLHLDRDDPQQAALMSVLEHRLPAGITPERLGDLIDEIASSGGHAGRPPSGPLPGEQPGTPPAPASGTPSATPPGPASGTPSGPLSGTPFDALRPEAREEITRDLRLFARRLGAEPYGIDLGDCALGNLVFAGAYLRTGEDFNAAVRACARTFGSPVRLLNVTGGENAFLTALKRNGRLLTDEADIVAPQDDEAITDLFLLRRPIDHRLLAELEALPAARVREVLARHRADVTPNPEALDAIRDSDLLVYGPGTPHSSLLPSYLTPGVADAIAASRAVAKVFVVNTRDDHDIQGLTAPDLVDLTLSYLGDPRNERRTVTHVLCPRPTTPSDGLPPVVPVPRAVIDGGEWAGARWVMADLEDPGRPGVHGGRGTVDALMAICGEAALAGAE
ncbi:2-phospho-L-lactate transferase CofD family protein [Streptosporangium sp. DT93]|uniref:2-phospho-L-lactate transferase CofD family protein n=1 Tax=Streptosporangium sp. DT93 TaxID=3393428 RepID=UPI003CEC5F6E